jgi:hypothetical protein
MAKKKITLEALAAQMQKGFTSLETRIDKLDPDGAELCGGRRRHRRYQARDGHQKAGPSPSRVSSDAAFFVLEPRDSKGASGRRIPYAMKRYG